MPRPGTAARMPSATAKQEARAVLEAAAVAALAVARAQQLVAEVAVAVLDVDELKPDGVGAPRGVDEVVDEAVEVVVGHQRDAAGEALVEDGIDGARRAAPGGSTRSGARSGRSA